MSNLLLLAGLLLQAANTERVERVRVLPIVLPTRGALLIAGRSVDRVNLSATLKAHVAAGMRRITLSAEGSVPFSSVRDLMTIAHEAGIESVEFRHDKPTPPVVLAPASAPALRIKIREGALGVEILLKRESGIASMEDLRKLLRSQGKSPVGLPPVLVFSGIEPLPDHRLDRLIAQARATAHPGFQISFCIDLQEPDNASQIFQ